MVATPTTAAPAAHWAAGTVESTAAAATLLLSTSAHEAAVVTAKATAATAGPAVEMLRPPAVTLVMPATARSTRTAILESLARTRAMPLGAALVSHRTTLRSTGRGPALLRPKPIEPVRPNIRPMVRTELRSWLRSGLRTRLRAHLRAWLGSGFLARWRRGSDRRWCWRFGLGRAAGPLGFRLALFLGNWGVLGYGGGTAPLLHFHVANSLCWEWVDRGMRPHDGCWGSAQVWKALQAPGPCRANTVIQGMSFNPEVEPPRTPVRNGSRGPSNELRPSPPCP